MDTGNRNLDAFLKSEAYLILKKACRNYNFNQFSNVVEMVRDSQWLDDDTKTKVKGPNCDEADIPLLCPESN